MKPNKYFLLVPPLLSLVIPLIVSGRIAGMPIDDAYIFERYAHNLAAGAGYSFNPGEVSFGVTSFLWTVLNAFFLKIFPSIPFYILSRCLLLLSLVALIGIVEIWIYKETDSAPIALAGGFLCSIHPMIFMNAISGMESLFFAALMIAFAYVYRFYSMRKPLLLGMFAGLILLCRPEGLYGFLAVCSIEIYFSLREKKIGDLKKLLPFACGFALVALPYEIYMAISTGDLLPMTFFGKKAGAIGCGRAGILLKTMDAALYMLKGHARTITYFGWAGGVLWAGAVLFAVEIFSRALTLRKIETENKKVDFSWVAVVINAVLLSALWSTGLSSAFKVIAALLIVPSVLVNFAVCIKAKRGESQRPERATTSGFSLLAGILFFPAAYGLFFKAGPIFGGYYNRYIVVLVPAIIILAAKTFCAILPSYSKKTVAIIAALAMGYSAALTIRSIPENRASYENEIYLNENLREAAANWIKENTPPDAVVMVGYTGLGVVGGRSGRRVFDLGALINPDIGEYYRHLPCDFAKKWPGTVAYMKKHNVTYYVTVPGGRGDPHSNPAGEPGFTSAQKITDRSRQMFFNEIEIWRVDLK